MSGDATVLALVTDAFGGRGGIAQYNKDLLEALAAGGGRIEVLPRAAPDGVGHTPANLRQHRPRATRGGYVAAALRLAADLRPDIVFCGHINLAPLAALAARATGARLVVQFHGVEAWDTPSAARRRSVEAAALVLCVSRYTRARVLSWADLPPERAAVLPNTVSERFQPGEAGEVRRRLGLEGKLALLTVGRLSAGERYKGQDRIIRLLAELRARFGDVVYLIAGDGDDRPRLEAMAAECNVGDAVRFLGQVADEALADLYRAADLFVMASTKEGFGIVFLEAMACGTPALGMAAGGASDALGDGRLGAMVSESDLLDGLIGQLSAPRPDPLRLSDAVRRTFGREIFAARARALFASVGAPR